MACPQIVYNGYTLPNVFGPYSLSQTPTDLFFSCNFMLEAASSSALIAQEAALLTAMKVVKGTFTASFNSASEFNLSHALTGGTGFNARATVTKIEHPTLSTALTRVFSFTVKIELPYTQDSGRISALMNFDYLPNRQVIANFEAVYSASTSQNALTIAAADSWASDTLAAIFTGGEIFEIVGEKKIQDHNQKRATVKKIYKQVLYPPSTDSTTLSKVVDAHLLFSLEYASPVGSMITASANATKNLLLKLDYAGFFDSKTIATVDDMANVWQQQLRLRLLSQATTILKTSTYNYTNPTIFILDESFKIDASNYKITANMLVGCKISGTHLTLVKEILTTYIDEGINLAKLWDGKPFTYHLWSLGRTLTLIRDVTKVGIGERPTIEPMQSNFGITSGQWVRRSSKETDAKEYKGYKISGSAGGATDVTIYSVSWQEQYICVDISSYTDAIQGGYISDPGSVYRKT